MGVENIGRWGVFGRAVFEASFQPTLADLFFFSLIVVQHGGNKTCRPNTIIGLKPTRKKVVKNIKYAENFRKFSANLNSKSTKSLQRDVTR